MAKRQNRKARKQAARKIQRRIDKGRPVTQRTINRIASSTGLDANKVSNISNRKKLPVLPEGLMQPGATVRGDGSGARTRQENYVNETFDPSFRLSFDGRGYGYRNPANLNAGGRMGNFTHNENAIDYLEPLYQFSPGELNTAAQRLGITNVNSKKEANKLYKELVNPSAGGKQTGGLGGGLGKRTISDGARLGRLLLPLIQGGNLTNKEITALKDAGFSGGQIKRRAAAMADKRGMDLFIGSKNKFKTYKQTGIDDRTTGPNAKHSVGTGNNYGRGGGDGGVETPAGTDMDDTLQKFLQILAQQQQNNALGNLQAGFGSGMAGRSGIGGTSQMRSRGSQYNSINQ